MSQMPLLVAPYILLLRPNLLIQYSLNVSFHMFALLTLLLFFQLLIFLLFLLLYILPKMFLFSLANMTGDLGIQLCARLS
jgi:hypothetical protein